MRILLTAFEPLDGGINASKELIRSLENDPPSQCPCFGELVACKLMPGDTRRLKGELIAAIDRFDADCCVCVGQAPGRNKITLERLATNLKDFGSPDAAGNLAVGELIEEDGPAAYWSTLPDMPGMIDALNAAGIPAAPSNHAGNHLCNQILYHALHHAATERPALKAGFVHIPLLPAQVQGISQDTPFMSLQMLRDAMAIILNRLATQHEP